jgi:murein DD-endopeptidase MepM/ murein hydrolase activator NlpD
MNNFKIKRNNLTRNYNISASPIFLWSFVAVMLLLASFVLYGIIHLGVQKGKNAQLLKVKSENIELRRKLDHYAAQVDSILTILDKIQKKNEKIQTKNKSQSYRYSHPDLESETITDNDFYYDSYLYAQNHYVNQRLSNVISYLPEVMRQNNITQHSSLNEDEQFAEIPSIYPAFGRLSDCWGNRFHPVYHAILFHYGLDIANKIGTPVYATASGTVAYNGYDQYYGRIIKISHGKVYETRYAHLFRSTVLTGDIVKKGQIIGYIGDSGLSTGPHLHYEIVANGAKVNPSHYLNRLTYNIVTRHASQESKIIR